MKNYFGVIFSCIWTFGYFYYFKGVQSELGMMIIWFIIWIIIALPWGILSILGLVDENKRNIKSIFNNKLGRYFIFLLGLILFLWAIAILIYISYEVIILFDMDMSSGLIGLFISFLFMRTGYKIMQKYPIR
jgi:hypothetical protein